METIKVKEKTIQISRHFKERFPRGLDLAQVLEESYIMKEVERFKLKHYPRTTYLFWEPESLVIVVGRKRTLVTCYECKMELWVKLWIDNTPRDTWVKWL